MERRQDVSAQIQTVRVGLGSSFTRLCGCWAPPPPGTRLFQREPLP